jgi:phage baseplate assembly protein gpV
MRETGIRVGRVSSVDFERGMMQVVYSDKDHAVTTKLPYANFNNEYAMPKIGEQVLVAHLSNGSSRGVVLGTMWNRKNLPEENGKGLYRKELSKTRGAAYVRYDDEKGEYLVRVPVVQLHGVDRTDLEGPEVNIAANIRTSFESPEHEVSVGSVRVAGLETEEIGIEVADNVSVSMSAGDLKALIRSVELEAVEACGITAERIRMEARGELCLEDGGFSTTLSGIMGRLEALDGDVSARK